MAERNVTQNTSEEVLIIKLTVGWKSTGRSNCHSEKRSAVKYHNPGHYVSAPEEMASLDPSAAPGVEQGLGEVRSECPSQGPKYQGTDTRNSFLQQGEQEQKTRNNH